mgnify:CR=1 FL=1
MTFLSINTSTDICSVSIYHNNKFKTMVEKNTREHSKYLPLFTQKLIKEVESQLQYIALCIGPGSFTGLKIGSSFAKGLATSLDIPIVPIDNYETFKEQVQGVDKYYLAIYSHRDYAFTCFVNNETFSEYKCMKINTINDYPVFGYGFPEKINIKYNKLIPCSEKTGILSMSKIELYKNKNNDNINPIYLYVTN